MDLVGFEPTASSMPWKRSNQLSYRPVNGLSQNRTDDLLVANEMFYQLNYEPNFISIASTLIQLIYISRLIMSKILTVFALEADGTEQSTKQISTYPESLIYNCKLSDSTIIGNSISMNSIQLHMKNM